MPEQGSSPLVECVANFSEGRDRRTIEAIAAAVAGVPGVGVLDWSADADHHRSVITFAGRPGDRRGGRRGGGRGGGAD